MRYFNLRYFKRFKHFSFKYRVTCLFDVQANNYKTITIHEGFTRVSSPLCLFVSISFDFFRAMIHELERKIVLPWNKCYPRVQPNSSFIRLSKNAAIFIIFFSYFCRYRAWPILCPSSTSVRFHASKQTAIRISRQTNDVDRTSAISAAEQLGILASSHLYHDFLQSIVLEQLNWQRRKWQKGKNWFFTRVKYAEGKWRMME